jgi:hypothetical protein
MPQAGVSSRARRRYATPWWEELDRDAFRFPTEYRVNAAPRAAAERAVAPAEPAVAPAERAVAPAPGVAPAQRAVAPAPRAASTTADAPLTRDGARVVDGGARVASGGVRVVEDGEAPVAEGGRRTVVIRGHGAERNLPVARPTLRRHERPGFRPDRAALWAVMLGLLLILVAATSAHAAIPH